MSTRRALTVSCDVASIEWSRATAVDQDVAVAPPNSLLAFAVIAFAIIIIPGPSVMFVISGALACGRRAALLTVVGNAAGFYAQVVLVAFGLGPLLERSILADNTVKFVGALYLSSWRYSS